MVNSTQTQVDEAVMIAKNIAYNLAYDLTIKAKYGEDIKCCLPRLKLVWLYEGALACHVVGAETNCLTEEKATKLVAKIRSLCDN